MASDIERGDESETKAKKGRSPNHPVHDLGDAIGKAESLFSKYGRHAVSYTKALEHWGYKNTKSSSAAQCLAAVKAFGLVNVTGTKDARKVAVSESGERIVRRAPDRKELIATAALLPQIHRDVWDHYKGELPHDDVLKDYLKWEREEGQRFTEDAVDNFITKFRATLAFAGLARSEENGKNEGGEPDLENDDLTGPRIEVGDFVQWTSQGADQFEEPRQLIEISEDGKWAFVDGSRTGLPMDQLTKTEPPQTAKNEPPLNPHFKEGAGKSKGLPSGGSKPISLLVGFNDDGEPIYGHVAFDVPLRKGFLSRLGKQLKAMEEGATEDEDE